MKTICYVREENKKNIFTDDKEFSDFPLTVEARPDAAWDVSDFGRVIEDLTNQSKLILAECGDLGRNIFESLEVLSAIFSANAFLWIIEDDLYISRCVESSQWSELFLKLIEVERLRRSERSKNALKHRKAAGVVLGRPPSEGGSVLDQHEKQIKKSMRNGTTQKFLAIKYKVSTSNMSSWLKKKGMRRKRS